MDTIMSDIKKILDTLSEMAITSGSMATVATPLGGMKTRAKGTPSIYGEQTEETVEDKKETDDEIYNSKSPSNFGLWQNSYHQAEEQKKKKTQKKKVAESKRDEYYSELSSPKIQEIMQRMKKRYEADPRTKDSKKFADDLARKLRAAEKSYDKLDELGNSLMPGGLRSLNLAEDNLEEADLIIDPFERARSRSRSRDIVAKDTRQDHEVSMARSDLIQCIKNSEQILELISDMDDTDNLQAWVQEKIVKATDYLNTVAEYIEGQRSGVKLSRAKILNQQTGWKNQPTDYSEGYTAGQSALQREGEDLSWDDPDLVALRKRRPEFRSKTHPELDAPKKSRIKSVKRDGYTEFSGIDKEIARQRKLGNLEESDYRGHYSSKDEAISYAKATIKSFKDSVDGIEVWALPGGTYDVVHTMNSSGRNRIMNNDGQKIVTIRPKNINEITDSNSSQQTPEKQGWNAGFRQVEKTKNPYPAGSAEHDQWADGWNEANSQPDYYNESATDVAEGLSPQQKQAHQANLDAAQREMDRREAEGEDMTGATIDKKTYKIIKPKQMSVAEAGMSRAAKGNEKYGKDGMRALAKAGRLGASEKTLDTIRDKHDKYNESAVDHKKINSKHNARQSSVDEAYDGDPDEYFVLRHRSKRDIEKEITVPKLWSKVKQFDGFQEAKRARDEMSAKHPGERFTVTTHKKPSVAEGKNRGDIELKVTKLYDEDQILITATSHGKILGRVYFDIFDSQLIAADAEVASEYRNQGIASMIYDYAKELGWEVVRSGRQTDDGAGFWDKHRPKQDVWEQGVSEGLRDPFHEKYFGPTAGAIKKIFKIKIQDEDSKVRAFNVKAETEQQAKEIIEKHVPDAEILNIKFVKNLMAETEQIDEKKDACYNKVKSRYKVWPSAYASGALVKCRKVGAANWGNKSKK